MHRGFGDERDPLPLRLCIAALLVACSLPGVARAQAGEAAPVASVPPRPGDAPPAMLAAREERAKRRSRTLVLGIVVGVMVMVGGFVWGQRIRNRRTRR